MSIASFGDVLRDFRMRKHISQRTLAEKLGVHRNTIWSWEQGTHLPDSKSMVLELGRKLGLSDTETRQLLEASLTALSPHWSVPYLRNAFFTGRETFIDTLHQMLRTDHAVALTQSYALHGLGGIGKTQIALEYAYRYALDYSAVFWIEAETRESILTSMERIAAHLQLPEQRDADQQRIAAAVQHWLTTNGTWLLIWDNVEDPELLRRFLPPVRQGAFLITTRRPALGTLAQRIELPPMTPEEGMMFVLQRAQSLRENPLRERLSHNAQRFPPEWKDAQELVKVMGALPLALDQAGAYIEETGCSIADYLQRYTQQRTWLLDRRGTSGNDHPHTVTATFSLAYAQVKRNHPLAANLLCFCAFLYAEGIPEELFVANASPAGYFVAGNLYQLDQAIAALRSFSLVQRHTDTQTLSIHRLVQAVLQDGMSEQEASQWQKRVIQLLNTLFPEEGCWEQCERFLPHVLVIASAIPNETWSQELAHVLQKAAHYLYERAQYDQSERLYHQARRIWEQQGEAEPSLLATTLYGLALLYHRQGKYELALPLLEQSLHLREQVFGSEHPQVAYSLNALGVHYAERGQYIQAEALFQRALSIWEQALGAKHPQMAIALNNLAELCSYQANDERAEMLYQQALSIDMEAWEASTSTEPIHSPVLGSVHLHRTHPLTGLADLYQGRGEYTQAEALYREALRLREQDFGPEHPDLAFPLNGLAFLCQKQGRYEEAEQLHRRALSLQEHQLGPDHPERAQSLMGLAQLSEKQGKEDQAEGLFQEAWTIFEQRFGANHPRTIDARNHTTRSRKQQENVRRPFLDGSPVQEAVSPPIPKNHQRASVPPLLIIVRGKAEQAAYTRTISPREVTITCTICGHTVTQWQYPGRRIRYCSEACRALKRAQMQEERVRKQREKRQAEREGSKQAEPPSGV